VSFIAEGPNQVLFARARNGLFRSEDSGTEWVELAGGIETEIVNDLEFMESRMIATAAGGGIFYSDDAGATWTKAVIENPRRRATLPLLRIDNTLYAGTFEGLVSSRNDGESWEVIGKGLGVPIVHDLALDARTGQMLVAAEDGLYEKREQGYTRISFGADDVPVLSVAFAPSSSQRIYVGTDGRGVFVSDDGSATWGAAGGELGGRARVPQVSIDPTEPENVFARVLFERIYKSTTGGDEWRTVWTGMPIEEQIQSLAIAPSSPRFIYAGGDTQIFGSDDGGESWQARGLRGISTLALWVDPGDPGHVWAGTTDGLYVSRDAGRFWRGPLAPGTSISSIAGDPAGPFYLATKYRGVLVSYDDGETFGEFGLEAMSANQLLLDVKRKRLYARTPQGVFQAQLP
jgi:photosystem II stability/assembly factor-like uncharacterized protein